MATKIQKAHDRHVGHGGIFIPAGLFLGLAYGFATNDIVVGVMGGLGFGFFLFALVAVFKK